MKWQKKDKYVWFLKPFPHYQIEKFNGTKGNVTLTSNNIGILDEETGMYDFKEVKDDYTNRQVKAKIFCQLLKPLDGKLVQFKDSFFEGPFSDKDDMDLHVRFEIRVMKATSQIDINMAKLYFEAGQVNRLSIKQSLMRLNSNDNTHSNE